ncbi:MAG: DUF433 domain-containing protein [Isosphaeraceae bacterium]
MEAKTIQNASVAPEQPTDIRPVIREHIASTPEICGGKARIAGTRIQVKYLVILHERQHLSPEEIVSDFPHLTLADVYAALAYYHDHRETINAEIAADRAWYEEQSAKQPSKLQEALKAKLQEALKARKADESDNPLSSG